MVRRAAEHLVPILLSWGASSLRVPDSLLLSSFFKKWLSGAHALECKFCDVGIEARGMCIHFNGKGRSICPQFLPTALQGCWHDLGFGHTDSEAQSGYLVVGAQWVREELGL